MQNCATNTNTCTCITLIAMNMCLFLVFFFEIVNVLFTCIPKADCKDVLDVVFWKKRFSVQGPMISFEHNESTVWYVQKIRCVWFDV